MKAFPQLDSQTYDQFRDKGMDLRDYFAAKALQGMLADHTNDCDYLKETYEEFAESCARSAYIFADAMMEARK